MLYFQLINLVLSYFRWKHFSPIIRINVHLQFIKSGWCQLIQNEICKLMKIKVATYKTMVAYILNLLIYDFEQLYICNSQLLVFCHRIFRFPLFLFDVTFEFHCFYQHLWSLLKEFKVKVKMRARNQVAILKLELDLVNYANPLMQLGVFCNIW